MDTISRLNPSRFSHDRSRFSHLGYDLLDLHMMETTMNSQQDKAMRTDPSSMMTSLQFDNIILTPNLKPETTSHSHSQNRLIPGRLLIRTRP
ncbi:hypothetical protein J2P12_04210 [Candidatus Bathyarchaeota archaeon]|nr:hypothetical protein [Candidatus Bathyarchaeota archaeon]